MKDCFIIDAHMHIGVNGVFFAPKYDAKDYVSLMDENNISYSVCSDIPSLMEDCSLSLETAENFFEQSNKRMYSLCVFNPNYPEESLAVMEELRKKPYMVGIKIHPSLHGIDAESEESEPLWRFAADNDLTIMSHTWSVSSYNPVQKLSTPLKFEKFIKQFPSLNSITNETLRINIKKYLNYSYRKRTWRHCSHE